MKQFATPFRFTKPALLRLPAVLTATANLERFLQFITCLACMTRTSSRNNHASPFFITEHELIPVIKSPLSYSHLLKLHKRPVSISHHVVEPLHTPYRTNTIRTCSVQSELSPVPDLTSIYASSASYLALLVPPTARSRAKRDSRSKRAPTCSTVRIGKVLTAQPLAYILHHRDHDHDQQHISPIRDITLRLVPRPLIPPRSRFSWANYLPSPLYPNFPVTTATLAQSLVMPNTPPPALLPPPEGIFRTFDDLMASVQRVAKDQGYGIVKLRASNYRDGKPTRYDLVCDRGGVKYNSTAKKRNPSTRKIDCPFRAKAVCEVQLGNQWRFAIQEGRHNHEPRVPAGTPGQENAPLATSIRSFTNKLDRLNHDMAQGLMRIEQRLDNIEKRMENLEARAGGYEPRFQAIEQRLQGMEGPRMDGMGMDDVESRLLASTVM
ncbi:hypothetical protein FAVG1_10000 [Fusarium avenaceum]|nr:hypothetical protein FAVG1_10000 [Fusarium avenaceum]